MDIKKGDFVWVYFSKESKRNKDSQFSIANRHKEEVLSDPWEMGSKKTLVVNTTMHMRGRTLYSLDVLEKINHSF